MIKQKTEQDYFITCLENPQLLGTMSSCGAYITSPKPLLVSLLWALFHALLCPGRCKCMIRFQTLRSIMVLRRPGHAGEQRTENE